MAERFSGKVDIVDSSVKLTIHLDAENGDILIGGNGKNGDIALYKAGSSDADFGDLRNATIRLDGKQGNARLGGNGTDGDISLYKAGSAGADFGDLNKATIHLDGEEGNIMLGGNGKGGDLWLFPYSAVDQSDRSKATIHLNANTGDIRLSGADCAEHFNIAKGTTVETGTVLTIGQSGALQPCNEAYDKRVAGVVSGAGSFSPGLILDAGGSQDGRVAVALMGKVFCKVDATAYPIAAGDLLTTSATPGHAMKATDTTKAFGAVLGKAMAELSDGCGLIPILVTLQ